MKSFIWNIRRSLRSRPIRLPRVRVDRDQLSRWFSRYFLRTVFFLLFCGGMFAGALYSTRAGEWMIRRLDLLCTTDLSAGMQMSAVEIFLKHLAADLLFALAAFLLGVSVWGALGLPALMIFKGFALGLSTAVIFLMYKTVGVGFYILVLLPGAVIFLMGMINYAVYAQRLSWQFFRFAVFGSDSELRAGLKLYPIRSLMFLLFCVGAALMDMLLWVLFAHLFEF